MTLWLSRSFLRFLLSVPVCQCLGKRISPTGSSGGRQLFLTGFSFVISFLSRMGMFLLATPKRCSLFYPLLNSSALPWAVPQPSPRPLCSETS